MDTNTNVHLTDMNSTDKEQSVDIQDHVLEAYYGKMGLQFMRETQERVHWICEHVIGKRVLDVGCSQGIVPILLAREGCSVTGVDTSPKTISEAYQYLKEEPDHVQANVSYINADFLLHDFQSLQIDTLIMSEVLEHLVRPQRFIDAAASILPENGRLIITVPFGVNDFIDHKHTFYLLEPYQLIAEQFELEEISVLGKWIGLIARRRPAYKTSGTKFELTASQIQQLESGFLKIERTIRDELAATKRNLDEANKKYRTATEQIANFKQQLSQHETSQKAVENTLQQTKTQLSQTVEERERERARLGDEISQLKEELAIAKRNLDEANKKYRTATEQIATLKGQVTEIEESNKAVKNALNQKNIELSQSIEERERECTSLRDEIAQLKEELDSREAALQSALSRSSDFELQLGQAVQEHNKERTGLCNEITQLKLELDAQLSTLQASESRLSNLAAQLDQTVEERDRERANSSAEIVRLKHDLAARVSAVQSVEQHAKAQHLEAIRSSSAQDTLHALAMDEANRKLQLYARERDQQLARRVENLIASRQTEQHETLDESHPDTAALKSPDRFEKRKTRGKNDSFFALDLSLRRKKEKKVPVEKPVFKSMAPILQLQQVLGHNLSHEAALAPLPLKSLRVATIMDEFTHNSYRHECNLLQLTPQHWREELEKFKPQLLFIESAWRGKLDLWGSKVGHKSNEVLAIIDWCKKNKIPSVFWNKEDPVHFETFLGTAKLFDHVFTTDIDCIHRYKRALGHERVYLLPFACQPASNNPIETYSRKDAFCFAGAYYVRYPDRTRDLDNFIENLPTYKSVEIFDRNFGKQDINYQFPEQYKPYIVGNLPFTEIDRAYKGYRYAINLNSIKHSQSMFARRVYELLACNTITVSNFSRGLRLMFGDLVFTSDSGREILEKLKALKADATYLPRLQLMALRKVMQQHTYQQRFAYVASKAFNQSHDIRQPSVLLTGYARDDNNLSRLLNSFSNQEYQTCYLMIAIREGFVPAEIPQLPNVMLVPARDLNNDALMQQLVDHFDWIGGLVAEDYYGSHYVTDMVLAAAYSDAAYIGKAARYEWHNSKGFRLLESESAYRYVQKLAVRSSFIAANQLPFLAKNLQQWFTGLYQQEINHPRCLALDPFNYCRNVDGSKIPAEKLDLLGDISDINIGLDWAEIMSRSESIKKEDEIADDERLIPANQLAKYFNLKQAKHFKAKLHDGVIEITSNLADTKHEYLYASSELPPKDLGFTEGQGHFFLDVTPGLNLQMVLLFLDSAKNRISHAMLHGNRNQAVDLPENTAWVRLGLRVYASGSADIKNLVLGHRLIRPAEILSQTDTLLLTNHYPSYDDLYRNGFVHSRVAAYRQRGVKVDVFRLRPHQHDVTYHEFKDIDIVTANQSVLEQMLGTGRYNSVLVHFLDESMWQVLQRHIDKLKVYVWVHGAEIQSWHRRDFNFEEQQREAAKVQSEARMKFWRELLQPMPENLKLIFVSKYFAEEVMEDLELRLPENQYRIIHNPINTELFAYHPKPVEQRKKILSIRPYASRVYANDLSVRAILTLAEKPYFKDLEFRMIGDGKLFEETLASLQGLSNVIIERRFLTQSEIADIHREYGVFLCPSRMDTQGVSRDEAMSSGLVPITNSVGAIPEFVDETCGMLVPAEGWEEMAHGIEMLYQQPELFSAMSKAAAERVRSQSSMKKMLDAEIAVFKDF